MTLYELTSEWEAVQALATDPEADPEAVEGSIESIEGALEDKVDGYGMVIKNLKSEATAIAAEIERLKARRDAALNGAKRLEANLETSMARMGVKKLPGTLFTFWVQNNPKKVVYQFDDIDDVPEDFTFYIKQVDREKVRAALDKGFDLGFAHLEQGQSLRMK